MFGCGAPVEPNPEHVERFLVAAAEGNADDVSKMLGDGVDVNTIAVSDCRGWRAQRGDTALMAAARSNHKDMVLILLSKGANPNVRSSRGATAFDIANTRAPSHWAIAEILDVVTEKGDTGSELLDSADADGWRKYKKLKLDQLSERTLDRHYLSTVIGSADNALRLNRYPLDDAWRQRPYGCNGTLEPAGIDQSYFVESFFEFIAGEYDHYDWPLKVETKKWMTDRVSRPSISSKFERVADVRWSLRWTDLGRVVSFDGAKLESSSTFPIALFPHFTARVNKGEISLEVPLESQYIEGKLESHVIHEDTPDGAVYVIPTENDVFLCYMDFRSNTVDSSYVVGRSEYASAFKNAFNATTSIGETV